MRGLAEAASTHLRDATTMVAQHGDEWCGRRISVLERSIDFFCDCRPRYLWYYVELSVAGLELLLFGSVRIHVIFRVRQTSRNTSSRYFQSHLPNTEIAPNITCEE